MRALAAAIGLLTAVSCGDTRLYEAVGSSLLEGTWARACHLSAFPESGGVTFPITELWDFSGSSFTKSITAYDPTDPSCSGSPIFIIRHSYTLATPSRSSAVSGAMDLDLAFTRITKTPLTAATAAGLNATNACGLAPAWANGTETDITGRTCFVHPFSTAGTLSFELFQVSGDQLTIGDTLTTDEVTATRPTSLLSDALYTRQ